MPIEEITLAEFLEMIEKKDNTKIAEILLRFKDKWNLLIEETRKLKKHIHLSNISIVNQDLSGLDLSDTMIENSDFSGSDLSDSDLDNADITATNFISSKLENAKMHYTRISQSDMSNAVLYNVQGIPRMTGSVNLFGIYWRHEDIEKLYGTSVEKTKRDFRKIESYEHGDDDEHGNYS